MEKTCKTCINLAVEKDDNGGTAQDRSSAKISCKIGYFATKNAAAGTTSTVAPAARNITVEQKKTIAFNLAVVRYDDIPDQCNSYTEGINAYYNCQNCRNAIINKRGTVYDVVGCQIKSPVDNLDLIKIVFEQSQWAEGLTPVGCTYFSPDDEPAKPYHLAEVIKPSMQTNEQRIGSKYNSRTNKLSKKQYIMLVEVYNETGADIYLSLAQQSNKGEELTANQMGIVEKITENYKRITKSNFKAWQKRLDALLDVKTEGFDHDIPGYKVMLDKYGYLTALQDKRLTEVEMKEYGSEYYARKKAFKVLPEEKEKEEEIDIAILDEKPKTRFRRRNAWRNT